MEALRRPRGGISQAISIIAVILLISLSVAAFGLVLRQSSFVQGAQLTVAYQEVQRAKEDLRITIYPEYVWLAPENRFINMTRIRITSNWAGESTIDYIVAVKASGERVEGPVYIRIGAFEKVEGLKPSNLHPQLAKYDNDYNALANEVDYILFHTKLGNVFEASIGSSPTQKVIANVTSTTITRTSSITLTKVLVSTRTTTKMVWKCPNGWDFIGWAKVPGSYSSKYTTYTIMEPLVGAVTIYVPGNNPRYTCIGAYRDVRSYKYGKCTVYLTKTKSGCGTLAGYWFNADYFGCCTYEHVATHSTSCTFIYKTKTQKFSCPAPWTKTCRCPYVWGGWCECCCIRKTGFGFCVWLPADCKVWRARRGSNYVVVSYSLGNPGKIWCELFWEPYYSIYLCSTEFRHTTCHGTTTPGCPPPGCQEGATKCVGIDLYKCECVNKWYEPAKRWCPFCSWVLVKENAPECMSVTPTPSSSTSLICPQLTCPKPLCQKGATTRIGKYSYICVCTPSMIGASLVDPRCTNVVTWCDICRWQQLPPTTTQPTTTTTTPQSATTTTITITVTPTTTVYECVYATERAKFSVCGPTTIRTERVEAEGGVRVCTTTITPTPTYAIPTEMALAKPTPVAIGLILLGLIAYSPRKRKLELLLSILLLIGLILATAQPLMVPVSASGYTVTVTSTAPTVTKTVTTTIGTVLIETGYYYATCKYATVKYPVWYCACIVRDGHTTYISCELQSYKTWITSEMEGLTSTSVYTTTIRKGTCPG